MKAKDFRKQLLNSQRRLDDIASTAASSGVVSGKFRVNGSGEALKEIYFSGALGQPPTMNFITEILEGDHQVGYTPQISVTIYDWITIDRPPFSRFYRGAKLSVVSDGPPSLKFAVHWQATGIIFQEPFI